MRRGRRAYWWLDELLLLLLLLLLPEMWPRGALLRAPSSTPSTEPARPLIGEGGMRAVRAWMKELSDDVRRLFLHRCWGDIAAGEGGSTGAVSVCSGKPGEGGCAGRTVSSSHLRMRSIGGRAQGPAVSGSSGRLRDERADDATRLATGPAAGAGTACVLTASQRVSWRGTALYGSDSRTGDGEKRWRRWEQLALCNQGNACLKQLELSMSLYGSALMG